MGRWCGEGGADLDLAVDGGFTATALTAYYNRIGAGVEEGFLGTDTHEGQGQWGLSNAVPEVSQLSLEFSTDDVTYFLTGVRDASTVLWSELETDGDFVVLTRC